MKKAMKVVFLALLLCCLFFIASCAEKNDHIHRYAETVVPATCTEQGYTTHICSCGDCYTDSYIPAKGHAFADTLTYDAIGHWYAATCEHTSEKKGYVNHAFADTVIAPTCDKQGYTLHTCTCGYSYKDNIAPATGHKMKNGVCEVCGALEEPEDNTDFFSFILNPDRESYTVTGSCCTSARIAIPSTYKGKPVTEIGASAFRNNQFLRSVTIPGSITTIGNEVFCGCTSLTSVIILDGVTGIGEYSFAYCTDLVSVTIQGSVTTIGENAFYGCTALASVTIPGSVSTVGEAFRGCTGLKDVTIFEGVTTIGEDAFRGCTALTSVTIPSSVTAIGDSAFYACTDLTSVTISSSVTVIGNYAFRYCDQLADIHFDGTMEKWKAIKKGTAWNSSVGNSVGGYTVHCTDGDIENG